MKKIILFLIFGIISANFVFGQTKDFKTADEYLTEISNLEMQIKNYEAQCKSEIENKKGELEAERQSELKKIQESNPRETHPSWNSAKVADYKNTEAAKINKSYTERIEREEAIIQQKYATLINQANINKNTTEKKMLETTFKTDSKNENFDVKLPIGEYKVEETPQNWPFTVKCEKRELPFTYSGKILHEAESDDAKDEEFFDIEKGKESYKAVLSYAVVKEAETYKKMITKIEIVSGNSTASIRTYNDINEYVTEVKAEKTQLETSKKTEPPEKQQQKTKRVRVDDGWGDGAIISATLGGGVLLVGGGLLLFGGIYNVKELLLAGGVVAGIGPIGIIIGLCLPNDYHYEEVPIAMTDPVISNIQVAFTGKELYLGYKLTL